MSASSPNVPVRCLARRSSAPSVGSSTVVVIAPSPSSVLPVLPVVSTVLVVASSFAHPEHLAEPVAATHRGLHAHRDDERDAHDDDRDRER